MPRRSNPATRMDPTPGKGPAKPARDRGARRPAARRQNLRKVDAAADRDEAAQRRR